MNNLSKARQQTHQKDIDYRDTFMSPNGKRVLDDLEREFAPDRLGEDLVRVGESNVIRAIKRRVQNGMDG